MLRIASDFLRFIFTIGFFIFVFASWVTAASVRELHGSGFTMDHFGRFAIMPRDEPTCNLLLEGEIYPGDADRIIDRIDQLQEERGDLIGSVLCLNSPGGSLLDALRIASGVSVATRVRAGDECLSSCALIFMSGHVDFDESVPMAWRVLEPGGLLGFHAPSLGTSLGDLSEEEISSLYNLSLATIAEIASTLMTRFAGDIDRYFPPSLLAEMLATPPDEMMYIDTVDEAARWNIDVSTNWSSASILAMNLLDIARSCEASLRWQAAESAMPLVYRSERSFNAWYVDRDRITYVYNSYEGPIPSPFCSFRLPSDHDLPSGWIDSRDEVALDQAQVYVTLGNLEGLGNDESGHRNFALFPPDTALTDLGNFVSSTHDVHNMSEDDLTADPAERTATTCHLDAPQARITNVNQFTNLRSSAGIAQPIITRVPLNATITQANVGGYYATQRCLDICDRGDQRQVTQCIENNEVWIEVNYEGRYGFLSRQFLEAP